MTSAAVGLPGIEPRRREIRAVGRVTPGAGLKAQLGPRFGEAVSHVDRQTLLISENPHTHSVAQADQCFHWIIFFRAARS